MSSYFLSREICRRPFSKKILLTHSLSHVIQRQATLIERDVDFSLRVAVPLPTWSNASILPPMGGGYGCT